MPDVPELDLDQAPPHPAAVPRTYRQRQQPRIRLTDGLYAELQRVADETGTSAARLARIAVWRYLRPVDLTARADQWLQRAAAAQGHDDTARALVELLDYLATRYPNGIVWPDARPDLQAELQVHPWLR